VDIHELIFNADFLFVEIALEKVPGCIEHGVCIDVYINGENFRGILRANSNTRSS
jgi:hypothetical protein